MSIQNIPFLCFADPFSSISHFVGVALAFVGAGFLFRKGQGNALRMFALGLYSFCLIFMFSMSAVFHLLDVGFTARAVMQRLDHAAIWTMIAGSFTPIHIVMFRGWWRWGVLSLIWTVAITGLVLKTVFFYDIPDWLGLLFYLSLGWIGLFTFIKIYKVYGKENLRLLVLGGVFYTIGALFEFLHWPTLIPGVIAAHEIFHVFVLLGAFSQWLFIYQWAATPVSDHIKFVIRERPGPEYFASAIGENIQFTSNSLIEVKSHILESVQSRYHHKMPATTRQIEYIREEFL